MCCSAAARAYRGESYRKYYAQQLMMQDIVAKFTLGTGAGQARVSLIGFSSYTGDPDANSRTRLILDWSTSSTAVQNAIGSTTWKSVSALLPATAVVGGSSSEPHPHR